MAAPRLEIDLEKIHHNAYELVTRLNKQGISVTGVTKATLGSTEITNALLQAGVSSLCDSRIENIKAIRLTADAILMKQVPMILIRSPMLSQIEQVVKYADASCNTEIDVIKKLSIEAQKKGCTHQVLLMVELGDLREGIMPEDLIDTVREVINLPHILLKGIGTNLACRSGVAPDTANMDKLATLAEGIEKTFNLQLDIISGGEFSQLTVGLK